MTLTTGKPLNNNVRSRGHKFVGVNLVCAGNAFGGPIAATYTVNSTGASGSDENCDTGAGSGTFTGITKTNGLGPTALGGSYKFVRVGTFVYVWGTLTDNSVNPAHTEVFTAKTQFTPDPLDSTNDVPGCTGMTDPNGINSALLDGAALIGKPDLLSGTMCTAHGLLTTHAAGANDPCP